LDEISTVCLQIHKVGSPSVSRSYIIISPVKDEAERIETTLRSVAAQTIRPSLWIIVDDASRDETPEIVQRYANSNDWIYLHRIRGDSGRMLGSAEIKAFNAGFQLVRNAEYDFIVKLDGDLELPPDYFERLIAKFDQEERLGIASGIYLENRADNWVPVSCPPYHAAGASKMVRAECFRDIGGFPLYPGWDTADEIKAQTRGWKTRHFPEIQFKHLRNEGTANGSFSTNILHGEVYYVTGGGWLFFALKCVHRSLFNQPWILGGCAMLWGYMKVVLRGGARLVTKDEMNLYRQIQNQRLREGLSQTIGLVKHRPSVKEF
jgi:poly-beta-1,6-N-acetyl-D-glucosamine synthase